PLAGVRADHAGVLSAVKKRRRPDAHRFRPTKETASAGRHPYITALRASCQKPCYFFSLTVTEKFSDVWRPSGPVVVTVASLVTSSASSLALKVNVPEVWSEPMSMSLLVTSTPLGRLVKLTLIFSRKPSRLIRTVTSSVPPR